MPVMRSVFYVPGNSDTFISKAPSLPADIITLDLEDSVPPAEKPKAREMTRENLLHVGSGGSTVYVRINNWETLMTDDDLEQRLRSHFRAIDPGRAPRGLALTIGEALGRRPNRPA